MENWKKAVIFGGIGAGAVLFATGRRPAGMVLADLYGPAKLVRDGAARQSGACVSQRQRFRESAGR